MSRYFVTNIWADGHQANFVKLGIHDTDFSWHGYTEKVGYVSWKSDPRAIARVVKTDTPPCRGIRYEQFDTRTYSHKRYKYRDTVEGQIFRDSLPSIE